MIIKITKENEEIYIDDVDFIIYEDNSIQVSTRDGKLTSISSADGVIAKIFTDNGVEIVEGEN